MTNHGYLSQAFERYYTGILDLDEVALQLDVLVAQLELNEKKVRLERYLHAKAYCQEWDL